MRDYRATSHTRAEVVVGVWHHYLPLSPHTYYMSRHWQLIGYYIYPKEDKFDGWFNGIRPSSSSLSTSSPLSYHSHVIDQQWRARRRNGHIILWQICVSMGRLTLRRVFVCRWAISGTRPLVPARTYARPTWLDITFPVLFAYYTKLGECCARIGKFCLLFIYGHKYLCGCSEWATIMIFFHSPRRSVTYTKPNRSGVHGKRSVFHSLPFAPPLNELSSLKVGVIILMWWWW